MVVITQGVSQRKYTITQGIMNDHSRLHQGCETNTCYGPSSCQRSDRTHNCRQTLLNVARDTRVMCYMSCTCTHMFAALYLRFHTSSDLSQQSSTHVDVHMFVLSRAIAQANDVQRDRISIM